MKKIFLLIILAFTLNLYAQQYSLIPKPIYANARISEAFKMDGRQIYGYCQDSIFNIQFVKKFFKSNDSNPKMTRIDIFMDPDSTKHSTYHIQINKQDITIKAGRLGVYPALQTIAQLNENGTLFEGEIMDYPSYSYRGMHLDVCRHFFTVAEIKKYLNILARYKFNTFHWHLTEDQGWRIEIKKYPKLTEVGSRRSETLIGRQKDEIGTGNYDKTPEQGFYTQDQIKEVIAYAQDRFITIIPEIELPGHSLAAIASYPHLGCTGKPTEVGKRWGVYDNVYCAGKESTFQFLEDVLTEVIALFPSKYIHIGGDEVVKKNWKKCSICQQRIKAENLKDENELQSYFIQRIEKFLNAKGRQIIGWDEILEGGLAPNATVMSWRGEKGGIEAAKAKHQVIMTPGSPCYFDHAYSKSSEEPVNIGGNNSVEDIYNYNPNPFTIGDSSYKFILGAQGNVWTEYIPDWAQVEYMTLPRIQALSEALWTAQNIKYYPDFQHRLIKELEWMDSKNINFRIPEPIGYQDTLIISQKTTWQYTPQVSSYFISAAIDGKSIPVNHNSIYLEPFHKSRILTIYVSNGKRKSIGFKTYIPGIKK